MWRSNHSHTQLGKVQATLEGLDRWLKSEFTNIQRQLEPLSNVPARLATLEERQTAAQADIDELKSADERHGSTFIQWAAIGTAALVGVGTMIINLVQVAHG